MALKSKPGLLLSSVLIVDDVDEMREMLVTLVNGFSSYKVSGSSANCAEARLEVLRRRPSLVLLDEILPGESTLDFLQELIQEKIPVILMTGMENPEHALPAGAAARLIKPDWRNLNEAGPKIEGLFTSVLKPTLAKV